MFCTNCKKVQILNRVKIKAKIVRDAPKTHNLFVPPCFENLSPPLVRVGRGLIPL